jgi:hypothetical protein
VKAIAELISRPLISRPLVAALRPYDEYGVARPSKDSWPEERTPLDGEKLAVTSEVKNEKNSEKGYRYETCRSAMRFSIAYALTNMQHTMRASLSLIFSFKNNARSARPPDISSWKFIKNVDHLFQKFHGQMIVERSIFGLGASQALSWMEIVKLAR